MLSWLHRLFFGRPEAGAGVRGEQLAADWLRRERRFAVVTRNWHSTRDRRDELDLVCRDGDVLVFVEVKTRDAGALVPGYYAVNKRKRRALRRAIDAYLAQLRPAPRTFRFDVVEVTEGEQAGAPVVRHFENVPLFTKTYHR